MLLGIVAHVRAQELAQNLRGFKAPNQGRQEGAMTCSRSSP
jgi:hypothetical protein